MGLNLIDPLTRDGTNLRRKRNNLPCASALKRNNLLSHAELPLRMDNSLTVIGRLRNGLDTIGSRISRIYYFRRRTRLGTKSIRWWRRWCTRSRGCIRGLGDNTRTPSIVEREGRRRRNIRRRQRGGNPGEEGAEEDDEEEEERVGVEGTEVRVDGTEGGVDCIRST